MKIEMQPDGGVIVTNANEGRENPDKTPAIDSWSIKPEQLSAHIRGLDSSHPWAGLSKGDKSAARDAASEFDKQRNS